MAQYQDEQSPVSGYTTRLQQQFEHLTAEMKRCANEEEKLDLVKWYFENGEKFGSSREDLERLISNSSELRSLLSHRLLSSPVQGKYPPHFRIGDPVMVVVNAKNTVARNGKIRDLTWHYKNGEWAYFISENGKKISKRYLKPDLIALPV